MSKSQLFIPTEGPCAGHPCDNCWTCRQGRCCRRDNPDYRLPELGEWDGSIHGEIGVLADDGQKAQCHICGDFFDQVGKHIVIHDVTPQEYRAIFGLNKSFGLAGPAYKENLRQKMRNEPGRIERVSAMGKAWTQTLTPEQRSGFVLRKRRPQAITASAAGLRERFSNHPNANLALNPEQILAIRSISPRPATKEQFAKLADQYGVTPQTIQRVLYRKTARMLEPNVSVVQPEKTGSAKLTADQVDEIRKRLDSGQRQRDIAIDFQVCQGTISGIATGKHYPPKVAA